MAAPNIVNLTTITGKTATSTPSNTSSNVLVANSASSNKVFKINSIIATNVHGTTAIDCTVAINSVAAGNGTSYPLIYTVTIPADAALIVSDKSTAFYLEEDKSIVATSGASNGITYTVSYEEIS